MRALRHDRVEALAQEALWWARQPRREAPSMFSTSRYTVRRHMPPRTLVHVTAVAGLLLAVMAPVGQAAQDSVTGTGRHQGADPPYPSIQVHINAFADATGIDPRGTLISDMTNTTAEGRYEGRVTCLSVFGNQATVGIEIVNASNPAFVGMGQLWSVVDNGQPGDSDRIAGYPLSPTPPVACPPLFFNVSLVSGNYVVRDTVP